MLVSFLVGNPPPPIDWNSFIPKQNPSTIKPIGRYTGDKGHQVLSTIIFQEPSIFEDAVDEFLASTKRNKSARKLAFLQAYGANINAINALGDPLVIQALKDGNRIAIDFFLSQPGLNINKADHYGQTPLTIAILKRQWEAAARLIQRNTDRPKKDDLGKTAFDWLALQGEPAQTKRLLALAGKKVSKSQKLKWMHRSQVQQKYLERLRKASYGERESRLWNACTTGNLSDLMTVHRLFPYHMPLLDNELSPLAVVAGNGLLDHAKLLLTLGASVNQSGRSGLTPLMIAAFCGNPDMLQLLLDNGAKIEEKTVLGQTALFLAASGGRPQTVELLLKANADPNLMDEEDMTPLELAAHYGAAEVVQKLLDCPRLNLSEQGRSAARLARKSGYPEVSQTILEQLARVENRANCGPLKNLWLSFWDCLY